MKLEDLGQRYSSGELLTGDLKKVLIEKLQAMVLKHQQARASISDDLVREFMTQRKLNF